MCGTHFNHAGMQYNIAFRAMRERYSKSIYIMEKKHMRSNFNPFQAHLQPGNSKGYRSCKLVDLERQVPTLFLQ